MDDAFERVFLSGGWLGVLAFIALVVAYVKDKQLHALQNLRAQESRQVALLLHALVTRSGFRKPVVSIADDTDLEEITDIHSVRDRLLEQATTDIDPEVRRIVERFNRGED